MKITFQVRIFSLILTVLIPVTTHVRADSSPLKFTPRLFSSFTIPISDTWTPNPAIGGHLHCPTPAKNIDMLLGGTVGRMESESDPYEVLLIQFDVLCSITIIPLDWITIAPVVGLTSTMIYWDTDDLTYTDEVFRDSESEFGFKAGIELSKHFHRIVVGVPVSFSTVFSSPELFHSVSVGLFIGIEIKERKNQGVSINSSKEVESEIQ